MTTQCPHCRKPINAYGITRHAAVCVERPGVRDLVRQLLARPDAPDCAMSAREYMRAAIAHNAQPGMGLRAPSQRALGEVLGGWRDVCAWAGLQYTRTKPAPNRAERAMEEVAQALEYDAALRSHERERGLEVCAVRELPGGGVAYLLR